MKLVKINQYSDMKIIDTNYMIRLFINQTGEMAYKAFDKQVCKHTTSRSDK